jgi:hypothetical protein
MKLTCEEAPSGGERGLIFRPVGLFNEKNINNAFTFSLLKHLAFETECKMS